MEKGDTVWVKAEITDVNDLGFIEVDGETHYYVPYEDEFTTDDRMKALEAAGEALIEYTEADAAYEGDLDTLERYKAANRELLEAGQRLIDLDKPEQDWRPYPPGTNADNDKVVLLRDSESPHPWPEPRDWNSHITGDSPSEFEQFYHGKFADGSGPFVDLPKLEGE